MWKGTFLPYNVAPQKWLPQVSAALWVARISSQKSLKLGYHTSRVLGNPFKAPCTRSCYQSRSGTGFSNQLPYSYGRHDASNAGTNWKYIAAHHLVTSIVVKREVVCFAALSGLDHPIGYTVPGRTCRQIPNRNLIFSTFNRMIYNTKPSGSDGILSINSIPRLVRNISIPRKRRQCSQQKNIPRWNSFSGS